MKPRDLHYIIEGDRHKPVILFLHGFMGSSADFQEVVDLLKDDFCCLLIDLPEHGKTGRQGEWRENYGMSDVAVAIIELLKKLAIERCFLIGYSMGGRLALYLAIFFPHYFLKVVLESASPGLETQLAREERIKKDLLLAKRLETEDFALFIEQWYQKPLFASFVRHPKYQRAISQRLQNNPFKLAKSLHCLGLGVQPSLWKGLVKIEVSTLLVVGELDSKFVAINQRINSKSLQFKLKIVENTGHNVHLEQSQQFAQIVSFFCRAIL